jgi:hypothetical protein
VLLGRLERLTNLLTPTQFSCVSRHDVHCTLNMYQNGLSSVSLGRRLVTLVGKGYLAQVIPPGAAVRAASSIHGRNGADTYPASSASRVRAYIAWARFN